MYFWYKFFTYLFYPFSPIYLLFRKIKKKEDSTSYKQKLSIIELSREKGFLIWKKYSPWDRAAIIRKIADSMRKKNNELAKWMTLETGKPLAESLAEVSGSADIF